MTSREPVGGSIDRGGAAPPTYPGPMADRPCTKLAELLEHACAEDRKSITAWLLDSRLSLSATTVEDYWAARRLRAGQIIRDLSPVDSSTVAVRQ